MFPITQVNRNNLQHCAFQDWKHAVDTLKQQDDILDPHTHTPSRFTHTPSRFMPMARHFW